MSTETKSKIEELEKRIENMKGSVCEVYSRVVGYHSPVQNWNDGKKNEFGKRETYQVES